MQYRRIIMRWTAEEEIEMVDALPSTEELAALLADEDVVSVAFETE